MNVLIFGASGATGQQLVRQALAQGHTVTAFVRTPAKLEIKSDALKLVRGDVKEYESVERAVRGQDAVLSALGGSKPLKSDPVVIGGVQNIIKAMKQNNVKRFVYLSFIGVNESRMDQGFLMRHVAARLLHNEIADHETKEQLVRSSGLDWTIVRPPKLTNGRPKGTHRSGEDVTSGSLFPMVARGDVADFMLGQLSDNTFMCKSPRVMY